MNIRLITFASALCALSFGCEMHPVADEGQTGAKERTKASAELQRALEPEPVNPHPPSFFPTPQVE
jgi:hypothetical protein